MYINSLVNTNFTNTKFSKQSNSLLNTYSVSEGILLQTQIYYTTWITQIFSRTKSSFMQGLGVHTSPSFDLFTLFLLFSHTQFTKFTCVDLMLIYVIFYFQLPKSQSSHKRITHDCMHTPSHTCVGAHWIHCAAWSPSACFKATWRHVYVLEQIWFWGFKFWNVNSHLNCWVDRWYIRVGFRASGSYQNLAAKCKE